MSGGKSSVQNVIVKGSKAFDVMPAGKALQGRRVRAVDGFYPKTTGTFAEKPMPKVHAMPVVPKPSPTEIQPVHHAEKTVVAHRPERSKTLMRHTVKSPVVKSQKVEQVQSPTDVVKFKPKVLGVKPKVSSEVIDNARAERANNTLRSRKVVRFRHEKTAASHAAATVSVAQISQPVAKPPQLPARTNVHEQNMFEQAIETATSHEQPAAKNSAQNSPRRQTSHPVGKHFRSCRRSDIPWRFHRIPEQSRA